eukprot:14855004-Heterocapsa_arctica.AAC.1
MAYWAELADCLRSPRESKAYLTMILFYGVLSHNAAQPRGALIYSVFFYFCGIMIALTCCLTSYC